MSGQQGGSEKAIRDLFAKAEEEAPCVVFFDEIDSIAPNREKTQDETMRRVVATLLTCMDGMKSESRVMVIGATNRPNAMDPALRRAGRFDAEIVIPVPSKEARVEILTIMTKVSCSPQFFLFFLFYDWIIHLLVITPTFVCVCAR
jgi:transitional endoplasmic reticulum ATPase